MCQREGKTAWAWRVTVSLPDPRCHGGARSPQTHLRTQRKALWDTHPGAQRGAVPAVPTAPGGRTSPRAGWVGAHGAGTHGPWPSLHSRPQRHPGHEVLRPDVPQQHRVLGRPGPLRLPLSGQPAQQQRGRGSDGRPWDPGAQRLGQPAVGAAPGSPVSPPAMGRPWLSPDPSQPGLRLHGVHLQPTHPPTNPSAGRKSPCLPVTPPCSPQATPAPLPQGATAAGTPSALSRAPGVP